MDEAVEGGRGRWSTAVGLTFAVFALAIFDALALVVIPLALLLVGLPGSRRALWLIAGAGLLVAVFALPEEPLSNVSRGWGLTIAAAFLAVTVVQPRWPVTSRAVAAVGLAVGVAGIALLVTGQAGEVDQLIGSHLDALWTARISEMRAQLPESEWPAGLREAADQMPALQTQLFPALVSLQSLAALCLVSWWVRRLGRSDSESFRLGRLRDFRFNDQLIWLLIAGFVLILLPVSGFADRIALNLLGFMATLYTLRGVAIFVFLAANSGSVATKVFGGLVFVLLSQVALTAALLMGVGDTWLDVRSRLRPANPT